MSYIRTEEIKQKQREKMLEKVKQYDFNDIDKKRKETIKKNGTTLGRKKGCIGKKLGRNKKCKCCSNEFWVKPSTENRKYCSRTCKYSDPEMIAVYVEKLTYGRIKKSKENAHNTLEYKQYKNKVHRLSQKTYVDYKDTINPQNHPRTLCGVEGGYQLDHIKTVKECFDGGILPEVVADYKNLRMLPWKENVKRNTKEK